VLKLVLTLLVAPALVGAATLAARRWGQRLGGLVSAFPAIAFAVLLIDAHERGAEFAARAASSTLLGLVTLSTFVVIYGRVAERGVGPGRSLAAGWAAVGAVAAVIGGTEWGPTASLVIAAASLSGAYVALPRTRRLAAPPLPSLRYELPLRMAATAGLVAALSAAAAELGPHVGGILTALPVLASILAVFTQAQHGTPALQDLLRGMVSGMAAFVVFCALVAALVQPAGIATAFAAAVVGALAAQVAAALTTARGIPLAT
jgi:uncharacterized membrane protein (GlpM family)